MTTCEPIPQRTLDQLVLNTLDRRPERHGFEIAEAIGQRSGDLFHVGEGSLYPALQRMMVSGWIRGKWGRTAETRRAPYYRITGLGRRQLEIELASDRGVTGAIAAVLARA